MDADVYIAALEFPALEAGEVEREYLVSLQTPELQAVSHGEQGPPGRRGGPGPAGGSAIQRTAGETLSALRAVYEINDQVFCLDYRDGAHVDLLVGVTVSSATAGEPVTIQSAGPLDDSSWSWVLGSVWLGGDGQLTQSPPDDGYDLLIGSAVSATRIQLNLQRPIELE